MEEAVERAENAENQGRDLERIRKARESMNRIREEIRRDHGILDIGVLAIRELRDS